MQVLTKYRPQIRFVLKGVLMALLVFVILAFASPGLFDLYKSFLIQRAGGDPASPYLESPLTGFLGTEEVVIIRPETGEGEPVVLPVQKVLFEYIEVVDGCGIHFEGDCLNVRSGPGVDYPVVAQLRTNIVLKVGGKVEHDGRAWIKVVFDEWLRYPERAREDWYVAAEYVRVVLDEGDLTVWEHGKATSTKEIIVDRSEQKLYAYESGELFMEVRISTGLELSPTPRGTFSVFKKTPSRYMQGPIPGLAGSDYYDLPGVPWNLYFTHGGAVIHGAYWHDNFGQPWSHGCVNLLPADAKKLYTWADIGMRVVVRD